jgi:hypothetical protein
LMKINIPGPSRRSKPASSDGISLAQDDSGHEKSLFSPRWQPMRKVNVRL